MSGNLGSPEGMIYEDHFDAHNQPRKVPSADSFAAHLDSKQNLDPQHQKSNISLDPKMGRAFRDSDVNGTIAAFPQVPDSGFVFLLENPSLDLMNWDLPGAFKADEMDMDQSPGFDNGMFVDSNSGLPESAKQEDGSLMHFIKEDDNLGLRFITDSAKRDESNSDFVPGLLDGKPQHNFSMSQLSTISNHSSIPTNFDDRAAAHFDLDHGSVSNDYGELGTKRFDGDNRSPTGINPATAFGNQVSSHEFQHEQRAMDSLGVQYHTPETEVPNHPRSRRNTQSHRASFLAVNADFLPLTTTTSLTPSMNSMYSAQASFFSANQFNRSLFDQPPSLSSFASASKRILGLRLLKKKAQQSKDSAQSDVVEIDLESLDLPPDTEIIPTNPKGRTRGRKEDKAADLVDLSKIFVCTYCLRRFKRQEHLKRHFRSLHTAEKPYECPKCLKKFSRTDNLNQHLKVHKQEEEEEAARAVGRTITKEEDEM